MNFVSILVSEDPWVDSLVVGHESANRVHPVILVPLLTEFHFENPDPSDTDDLDEWEDEGKLSAMKTFFEGKGYTAHVAGLMQDF